MTNVDSGRLLWKQPLQTRLYTSSLTTYCYKDMAVGVEGGLAQLALPGYIERQPTYPFSKAGCTSAVKLQKIGHLTSRDLGPWQSPTTATSWLKTIKSTIHVANENTEDTLRVVCSCTRYTHGLEQRFSSSMTCMIFRRPISHPTLTGNCISASSLTFRWSRHLHYV